MDNCPKCSKPLEARCPCGRDECRLTTPTRHCPSCDPDAHAKWNKMHGVSVCQEYVNRQLGL